MFEVDLLKPWIILGVLAVTIDWRFVVWILDRIFVAISGVRSSVTLSKRDLLAWVVKAAGLFAFLWSLQITSYSSLAPVLILTALLNALGSIIVYRSSFPDDTSSSQSSSKKWSLRERIATWVTLGIGLVWLIVSIFAWIPLALTEEETVVRSLAELKFDTNGVSNRYVLPRKVIKVERQGTTWWEIYPHFDDDTVYQVREAPTHNLLLSRIADHGVSEDRTGLILLSWKPTPADNGNAGGGLRIVTPTQVAMNDRAVPPIALISVEAVVRR